VTERSELTAEARAAYARYVAERGRVERGERTWADLAGEFFTEDAVFVDPAWGRAEGRDAIVRFMDESMRGLEDWTFPEECTVVDGDRIMSMWWNRLPGTSADGRPRQAPGMSIVHYAGDGRFSYELDVLNMVEVTEVIGAAGWRPPDNFVFPPAAPDRDPTPPGGG
jgi:ketosteroid isomerase-like protein